MISEKHKTIFIHIPKAGGQSIETMFLNDLDLDWNGRASLLLRKKKSSEKGPIRLAHLRARDYVDYGFITEALFNKYYKFSFVRNPYNRVFSFYNFLGYSKMISFHTFVKKVLPLKIKNKDFFFRSQYDYLYNAQGELLANYVGKLENINIDIQAVLEFAQIEKAQLPHVNKSKGEWKRAISLCIKSPYLIKHITFNNNKNSFTQDLKDEVYEIYQKDFQYFNYKS